MSRGGEGRGVLINAQNTNCVELSEDNDEEVK